MGFIDWWDSLTGVNVPFKLRLKTKKMNIHSFKKESELVGFIRFTNVPFKLRLKIEKRIDRFASKRKRAFFLEARSQFTFFSICCTLGGNRTHTLLPELDFESSASTNSATKAISVQNRQTCFGLANIIFLPKYETILT